MVFDPSRRPIVGMRSHASALDYGCRDRDANDAGIGLDGEDLLGRLTVAKESLLPNRMELRIRTAPESCAGVVN